VPLSAEDKRAEEARVNREIVANQKKPVIPFVGVAGGMSLSPGEHRWADTVQGSIVKTSIFTHERRVMYRERPAIQIEFTGNPNFKPRSDEQRVAQSTRTSFEVAAQRAARVRTLPCSRAPALRTWSAALLRRAPSTVPLPIWFIRIVRQPQNYRLDPFKLDRSPEYLFRDWSFLTAKPRAFFCPTTTSSRLARVIPV
jgi:hypothetical protein